MSPREVIENYEGGINAFLDPSKRIKGISTGFTKLDEMTGGLHRGELFILAARPSMGKTALALNIASHVATETRTRRSRSSRSKCRTSRCSPVCCAPRRASTASDSAPAI